MLPDGFKWFNYRTLQQHSENVAKYDEGRTLVLIKGGSIVTKKSETQKIEKTYQLMSEYPLELVVCLDDNGEAHGVYYDDDGLSEDHFNGKYVKKEFVFADNKLTSRSMDSNGLFEYNVMIDTIKIVGINEKPTNIKLFVDEKEQNIEFNYVESNKTVVLVSNIPVNSNWSVIGQ